MGLSEEARAEFRSRIELINKHIAAALVIHDTALGFSDRTPQGTVMFADLGQRKAIITANHVFKEFEECRHKENAALYLLDGTLKLALIDDSRSGTPYLDGGSGVFCTPFEIIDRNEKADLITIGLPKIAEMWVKKKWTSPVNYAVPSGDDEVMIVGYPGEDTDKTQPDYAFLGVAGYTFFISSVNQERLFVDLDVNTKRTEMFDLNGDPVDFARKNLGGFSGAPIWSQRDENQWSGIVTETSKPGGLVRRLIGARSSLVDRSGRIQSM